MVTYTIFSPITFRGRRTMSSYVSCNKTKFIRLNFSQDYMAHDFPQTAQIMRTQYSRGRQSVNSAKLRLKSIRFIIDALNLTQQCIHKCISVYEGAHKLECWIRNYWLILKGRLQTHYHFNIRRDMPTITNLWHNLSYKHLITHGHYLSWTLHKQLICNQNKDEPLVIG